MPLDLIKGRASRLGLLLAVSMLCAGCATSQAVPAAVIRARVVDAATDAPVAGARVSLVYVSPTGRNNHATEASLTNGDGEVTLRLPAQRLRSEPGALYFAGGFWRSINVSAQGYTDAGFNEGPRIGTFDRQVSVLRIRRAPYAPPPRNRHGAVRSLAIERYPGDSKRIYTTFELLEGPRAGTRIKVPMPSMQRDLIRPGTRFYLTRPLEEVETWILGPGSAGVLKLYFLRDAGKDEPYEPVTDPSSAPSS